MYKCNILSVNMRRMNAAMHALLSTNEEDDLLCVQEPWFNRIGVQRNDKEEHGKDISGGAAHPDFTLFYPYHTNTRIAKVMTYARKYARTDRGRRSTPIRTIPRLDLSSHPTLLITDHYVELDKLRIINFYNDVDDPSSLQSLLDLSLDTTFPTILIGDFNIHSRSWSPENIPRSPNAHKFESWAADQTLALQTTPGTITRRGREGERDSTLDLTFHNLATESHTVITPPTIDWAASLGSDHAGIRTSWLPETAARLQSLPPLRAFDLDADDNTFKDWRNDISQRCPPLTTPTSPETLEAMALSLQMAIHEATETHFKHKKRPPSHNKAWWNDDCSKAAAALRDAGARNAPQAECTSLRKNLTRVTRKAKREWADKVVTNGNIWEVAKWRHGRRSSDIAALRCSDDSLTFDPEEMSRILAERFFVKDPGDVAITQIDDPPQTPTRPFEPFTTKELTKLLTETAAASAPGVTGISWQIMKHAWSVIKDHMTAIANACITIGHHPQFWRHALVVVIPKPDRSDYTLAKNYRPISLIECLSKLVEKGMSKRFLYDIDKYRLVPTTQFGTRAFSSTLDAGLTITHDIQCAIRAKRRCAALLFDIKGFFDTVHRERLVETIRNLGFSDGVARWTRSFLTERRVTLTFNGITVADQDQPVGTPQGSPVSPVLSALYTSPLLKIPIVADGCTLGMYVDDGIIFAEGPNWEAVYQKLEAQYRVCEDWLRRNNLVIEPEKSELICFRSPGARKASEPPDRLFLPDTSRSTYYRVTPKATVRYLGFFLNQKLDWTPHVDIMCNRARASLRALQILGNSHRGLSMANWRLVFNAVCLPVLSYGCQLWANARNYKTLVGKAQVVFNEGVKVISGAFRTAPREPLHELTRVLPARHFFDKLTATSALRLYRVPVTSQLRSRLGADWAFDPRGGPDPGNGGLVTYQPPLVGPRVRAQRPTALEALGQRVPVEGPHADVVAIPPWEVPNWEGRTNHMGITTPQDRKAWVDDLYRSSPESGVSIISVAATVSNKGRYDDLMVGGAAAILNTGTGGSSRTWTRHRALGTEVTQYDVDLYALALGAQFLTDHYADRDPPTHVYLLSRSQAALSAITNTRNLVNQRSVLLFHTALTAFCSRHRDIGITLVWSPVVRERVQDSTVRSKALLACKLTPRASLNRVQSAAHQKRLMRKRAYAKWAAEWMEDQRAGKHTHSHSYQLALPFPPDGKNHPLWLAARKDLWPDGDSPPSRHTTTTALRFATGHAFTSDYARRFRKDLPEEANACECGHPDRTWDHLIYGCTRFEHIREKIRDFNYPTQDRMIRPEEFFSDPRCTELFLAYLQLSRAGFKPYVPPAVPVHPGHDPP